VIDVDARPGLVDALTMYERSEQSRQRAGGNVNGATRKGSHATVARTAEATRWIAGLLDGV
jgi:hypothetical protein